jgi:hypothetical protein
MKTIQSLVGRITAPLWLLLAAGIILVSGRALATGSFVALKNKPLSGRGGIGQMLLMTDGRVKCQFFGGTNWYMLKPDIHGSYVNGTWTNLALMVAGNRQFYSSDVLRDGRVFVAGGELGAGSGGTAEVYNPVNDHWTQIPVPNGLLNTNPLANGNNGGFSDSVSILLANGNVMIAPVYPTTNNVTMIFDPNQNTLSPGPTSLGSQNEVCWVKLPDGSILTIDKGPGTTTTERFIPSLNSGQGLWIADQNIPVQLYDGASEIGPGLLLSDGRAFFLGATGATAYYTPKGNTNFGSWTQGPNIPGGYVSSDAPAAMMVSGKILFAATQGVNNPPHRPVFFFEFDPFTTNFTQIIGPSGVAASINGVISDWYGMLALPDGNILVSDGSAPASQGAQLYEYIPDNPPLPAGKPAISSITANPDGSYHLVGTRLNGISQGAAYGDEMQMDSNYPLIRLSDGNNNYYYATTYNWSSTGVMTGNTPVSTEFTLPSEVLFNGAVAYSLVVVANGISSDPVTFYGPVWVDFNPNIAPQNGQYAFPFRTLAQGITAVPSGGTIMIRTPGIGSDHQPITNAMRITAYSGPATIN